MGVADKFYTPQNTRGYRLTIFTQLKQAIETMQQPDELFQWLASVIIQRFDVSIVQLWSFEDGMPGISPSTQLLSMASQNPEQPLHVINEKIGLAVAQISRSQRISYPQPVEQMYSGYVATLLKRYGLSYCAYCVIDRNPRSNPALNAYSQQATPAGFICTALLFFRQTLDLDLISTISVMLEQAFVIAENCHLFAPVAANSNYIPPVQETFTPDIPPALPDLVPRRRQDGGLMLSSNPFAHPSGISDRQSQRLYDAIDGRRSVANLCRITGMNLSEAQQSLQNLMQTQQIDMYTLDGWPVDSTLLFKNR
jgi:hypothetical protein